MIKMMAAKVKHLEHHVYFDHADLKKKVADGTEVLGPLPTERL